MNTAPHLRPLAIGDLFDAAFRLYRERFWTLTAIAALVFVPSTLLQSFFWGSLFGSRLFGAAGFFNAFNYYGVFFVTNMLWSLTLGNLLHGALINAGARAYLNQPISPIAAYRFGVRRYLRLVVASFIPLIIASVSRLIPSWLSALPYYLFLGSFLIGPAPAYQSWIQYLPIVLACLAGLLAIEIALLVISSYYLFVPQAVILEDNTPISAMRRSWSLVRGSIRRALAIVIAAGILNFMVSTAPSMIGSMLFRFSNASTTLFTLLFTVVGLVGQILLQPLLLAIFTLFYFDQRVRKEGYDLELLSQQAAW
jgi:hypothetical protein